MNSPGEGWERAAGRVDTIQLKPRAPHQHVQDGTGGTGRWDGVAGDYPVRAVASDLDRFDGGADREEELKHFFIAGDGGPEERGCLEVRRGDGVCFECVAAECMEILAAEH